MHKLVNIEDGFICSKCDSPAVHYYVIENRCYGSLFDDADGYKVKFHLCDHCNHEELPYMCYEKPIALNGNKIWLMEKLLMQFIKTFPDDVQDLVMYGEDYMNTYDAFQLANESYDEMIATCEVCDNEQEI